MQPFQIEKFDNRADWLAARRFGGSDAAAALGLSRWKSPMRLWTELTGKVAEDEDEEVSDAAQLGTYLEPWIHRRAIQGEDLEKRSVIYGADHFLLVRSTEHPWRTASPDALIVQTARNSRGVYLPMEEILRPDNVVRMNEYKATNEPWDHEPTTEAYVQVQHTMDVMDIDHCQITVLVGLGRDWQWYEVDRDLEFCMALRAHEQDYWERYVVADEPPPADGHRDTTRALNELLRTVHVDEVVLESSEAKQLVDWLEAAEVTRKGLETMEARMKNELRKAALLEARIDPRTVSEEAALDVVIPEVARFRWRRTLRRGYTVEPNYVTTFRRVKL